LQNIGSIIVIKVIKKKIFNKNQFNNKLLIINIVYNIESGGLLNIR